MRAATGELSRYLPMPISWVLAQDVADIALRACNTFLELAGIDRRVQEVRPSGDDPEFGSMVRMVRRGYPDPHHDCTRTTEELGRPPTPLTEGLGLTIQWLRRHGKL